MRSIVNSIGNNTPTNTSSTGFDWTNLIPAALGTGGAIIGGAVDIPTGVVPGAVAGGVGGAALGEGIRQNIKGENNLGQIALQGGLGLIPFGIGKIASKIGPLAKFAGSSILRNPLNPYKGTADIENSLLQKAGTIPEKAYQETFGQPGMTDYIRHPSEELFKGIPSEFIPNVEERARNLLSNLVKPIGQQNTFLDAMKQKYAYQNIGKYASDTPPPDAIFNQNVARLYKQLINQNVGGTGTLDTLLQTQHYLPNVLKGGIGLGIGGLVIGKLLDAIRGDHATFSNNY